MEPRIRIVLGGPMLVDGLPLGRLQHAGDAWRVEPVATPSDTYAICRCGRSSQMPLCDRSAPYGCFDEQPTTGPEPAPYRWDVPDPAGPPALALKPDGSGQRQRRHHLRRPGAAARDDPLCRCGESRSNPCARARTRWSVTGADRPARAARGARRQDVAVGPVPGPLVVRWCSPRPDRRRRSPRYRLIGRSNRICASVFDRSAAARCSGECAEDHARYWVPTSGPRRSICVGSCIAQKTSRSWSYVTTS